MRDLTDAAWRKSSRSSSQGNCVEVADNLPAVVGVRDSKDKQGPALVFEPAAWTQFLAGVKRDQLG